MSGKIHTRSGLKLTPLQESFAQAYTTYGTPTFFNAYQSLIRTRAFSGRRSSGYSYAYQLRNHPVIEARIQELFTAKGWDSNEVDARHLVLIKQDADLTNKMRAIGQYNRFRQSSLRKGLVVRVVNYGRLEPVEDTGRATRPVA